jgi:hypothetical protein
MPAPIKSSFWRSKQVVILALQASRHSGAPSKSSFWRSKQVVILAQPESLYFVVARRMPL